MSEPGPLHVVVRDLTDALRSERLPAQIFPAVPSAGRTGPPLSLRAGFLLCHGPIPPWMVFERVRAQRCQLDDELLAHRGRERRGDPDMVERVIVVVQAEQERADHRAGALLVPAEAGDHAVSRQADRKFGEFAEPAVDLDRAAVLLGDDVPADRQAETGALAGGLGRKEPVPLSRMRISTASPRSLVITFSTGRKFCSAPSR